MARPIRIARILAVVLLIGTNTGAVQAQSAFSKPPSRPRLRADQDSNSATAYYAYGISVLSQNPEKAAAAFYWASRLDPPWAAPVYGQFAALLLDQPASVLETYLLRREVALKDPRVQRIVDLSYQALLKNPFVDRRFDGTILSTWLARETNGTVQLRDLTIYDRRFAAWAAYARGDYDMAASVYLEAIKLYPNEPELQLWRAHSFFALGQKDSARTAVRAALALERVAETPWIGWSSHAYAEYSIGFLFDLDRQPDSARAAYERALLDDVSFHPAHRQLARLRLAAHDTAGALDEYAQAVALAPEEAGYLCELGVLLIASGQADSGATVLHLATAKEPYYALPHYPLGVMYQQSGFTNEAIEQLEAFVRLAPQSLGPTIAAAKARLTTLGR
jgi:tetratricopeptide (TPR) repeat protein